MSDEKFESLASIIAGAVGAMAVYYVDEPFASMPSSPSKKVLRDWWHKLVRTHGWYPSYAVFLMLPSDKEIFEYFSNYGLELHQISGNECLIMAFSKEDFGVPEFSAEIWQQAVENHMREGHSVRLANYFGIELTEFPCAVFFRDIRSTEHMIVSLNGLSVSEISWTMRELFSALSENFRKEKSVLKIIDSHLKNKQRTAHGKKAITRIGSLANKSLETAMSAWVKALIG